MFCVSIVLYVCSIVIYCALYCSMFICFIFFFKQKTAYEMRISDWSSDVCSSDLGEMSIYGTKNERISLVMPSQRLNPAHAIYGRSRAHSERLDRKSVV